MRKYIISAFAFIALASMGILLWVLPANFSWSGSDMSASCRDCHSGPKAKELRIEDVYEKIAALQYKHSVVEEGKCDQCHILRGFKVGRRWEFASSDIQKERIFFFKDLSWDRKYQVDLRIIDTGGKEISVAPIHFIPSQVTASINNDKQPPLIKDVAVTEIKQAVFLEATINWETDKPSNSIVEYGLTPKYGETTASEKIFANGHKITIAGLKAGAKYHYRVVSRDIFGNVGESTDLILDTNAQIKKDHGEKIISSIKPQLKEASIFKINGTNDILLKLSTDKPVKAYLVVNEPSEIDKHGFGLVPASASRIDACIKCHLQGASHPVGLRSRSSKTRISPILPTIEGGMITCVTCHYPHGGDKKYFARMSFGRDLCIECHTGDYF